MARTCSQLSRVAPCRQLIGLERRFLHERAVRIGFVDPQGLDLKSVGNWSPALDNASNKRFVAGYRAKYGRVPTTLGAMAYDNAMLLDAGVAAVKGDLSDKAKLRDAVRRADFPTVRGKIRFNTNNVPIQDLYLSVVDKGSDGVLYNKLLSTVAVDAADPHASACQLKW